MMSKYLVCTALLGMLAIILGAFGAHALKEILSNAELQSFETAVRYQMYHVLVLLFVQAAAPISQKSRRQISWLFFIGIAFFSGSIYAITMGIEAKNIWFVTPLGGVLLIIGWLKLAIDLWKQNKQSKKI